MKPRESAVIALALLTACGPATDSDTDLGEGPAQAILIAERFNTPDGRVMYMGAFPDLPSAPIDVASLTELGPEGDVFACAGHAFFYNPDAGTVTRYLVGADYRLTRDISLNVGQEGIQGWTGANICASDTEAFLLHETGGRAVLFNPTTMVLTEAFDLPLPPVDSSLYLQFFETVVVGDRAYFNLDAVNWDTLDKTPEAVIAVFDIPNRTISYDTDPRCQASLGLFAASNGDVYTIPEDGGFFATYSPTEDLPPDCFLKVPANGTTFDASFVTGLPAGKSLRSAWPIDDEHVLATVIDLNDAPPADDLWSWYELPVQPTRIHLPTGQTADYPSVPDVQPMNSRKLRLDGKSYYQVYTYDDEGLVARVDVVELTLDGAKPAFSLLGGDVLALDRLR
jgi:hypothetical protein